MRGLLTRVFIRSLDRIQDLFIHTRYFCKIGKQLFLFCGLFLPAAVWLGFRTEKLIAILIMLGSATTCSCFVMAKNMKHEGTITACTVMMTTLLSAFSLTMWLFVLKSLGYI